MGIGWGEDIVLEKMRKMLVRDLMNREVKFIKEDASLLDAVWKMKQFGVSSLIVESANKGDGYGIVTRKDLINKLIDPDPGAQHALVADVMTRPAIMVPPNISVSACVKLMKRYNLRRIPVFDGKEIVGVISNSDIFAKFYPGPSVD
ncbi:MAG: CBS domain-containing protein [Candidatus Abyssobacteria bacterium SURF_17]|uniref:CBS domain-containing protein n=1 Tax=Candidatus Abyssobacteria bacterium SURF_17 TaxID=2093361 RepID=A0A419EVQ0_9BACT|nr:MAG: CBS domain-containing protein [Candidatus Abyssubacteria bacterium SURF_17]